jgi:hypothetical protein
MFNIRSYEIYGVDGAACEIRNEISRRGCSEGWVGYSLQTLEDVKAALRKEGIAYVDDMFGRWERTDGPLVM